MVDASAVINGAASGFLLLFGIGALAVAGDKRRGVALAVYCVGFAGGTAVRNVETLLGRSTPALDAIRLVLYAAGGIGAMLFAASLARGPESRRRRGAAVAVWLGLAITWSALRWLHDGPAADVGTYTVPLLVCGGLAGSLLLAFQYRSRAVAGGSALELRTLAVSGAALAFYPAFWMLSLGVYGAGLPALAFTAAVTLPVPAVAFVWAFSGRAGGGAGPRNVALALVACGLAGLVLASVFQSGTDSTEPRFGLPGVTRLAGMAALAYCVFRLDLLHTNFHARVVRRGTLATAALASLFIVAQVAQNFFAAQYGLLMGGVVAGTLVFAASPLQRAMEAKANRQVAGNAGAVGPSAAAGSGASREEMYRNALRMALRDRRVTHEEERQLFHLAEGLGIGAGLAFELRHEVEAEARPRRRA